MIPGEAPLRYDLPGHKRIKERREFLQLKEKGARVVKGCLIANWSILPEGRSSKLGVITTKKIGGAVQRARVRRLIRETFRLHQYDFQKPVAMVLVARPSIAGKPLATVERDFLQIIRGARLGREV